MAKGKAGRPPFGKVYHSVEEVQKDRKELIDKFEGELPTYLTDFFDYRERQALNKKFFEERYKFIKGIPAEERREFVDQKNEEFWDKNKGRIRKKRKRLGSHLEAVYKEPTRNDEIAKEEHDLSQADKLALIKLSEKNIYLFACRYFNHLLKKKSSEFHKYLYDFLNRNLNKKKRHKGFKKAIAAPRGNAKSSIVSCILPIWCICYEKKNFIMLISDTASQAEDFLTDIKRELEGNLLLQQDFPQACFKGTTWRQDEILTSNGVKVMALGTGSKIRGRKIGASRPDLCHVENTIVKVDKEWHPVENYPNHRRKIEDGYNINIHGLPFYETVTEDHKYYTKSFQKYSDKQIEIHEGWKQAKDLINNSKYKDYIGYKIDYRIYAPRPIKMYYPGNIVERNSKGQIIRSGGTYKEEVPDEFYDKEFWWLVGLWWGDGYICDAHCFGLTINNKQYYIYEKIKRIAKKYGRKVCITSSRVGCFQIKISWSYITRWLKTWKYGNSRKTPPNWVEYIDIKFQKELVKGYVVADGFIDYKNNQVCLTSIHLDGLLSVRRLLMRIGIPSTIRHGIEGRKAIIAGHLCNTQKKYDLRFREKASILGYNITESNRYKLKRCFIENGYLWNKFFKKSYIANQVFIPIQTEDHTYTTHFGLSHNCIFDDLESSDMVRSKTMREFIRYQWFDKDAMQVGERGGITDFLVVGTILGSASLLNALMDVEQYPDWDSAKFKAVKKFSHSELWDEWKRLYTDRFDVNRKETARKFYEDNKEEMLEGTSILWPDGDTYYDLMIVKISNPSGFLCFKQNTPVVMGDRSLKSIENIKVGDVVLSGDGSKKEVKNISCRKSDSDIISIKISGVPNKVEATEEHPFLVWPKIKYGNISLTHQHLNKNLYISRTDRRRNEIHNRIFGNDYVWKYAGDLEVGDSLVFPIEEENHIESKNVVRTQQSWVYDGNLYSKIQNINRQSNNLENVYGIEVDGNKTYCVPNAIVHNSEYQNEPRDLTKVLFVEDDIHYEWFDTPDFAKLLRSRDIVYYGAIDPSLGKTSTSDYTCIVTLGRSIKTGYLFVVDIYLKRVSPERQVEDVLKKYAKFGYKKFGIETNAFQIVLKNNLAKASREVGAYIPIQELKNYNDKIMRIESLVPLIKDGTILFDKHKVLNNKQYALGMDMLLEFSSDNSHSYDDFPDALEMAVRLARKKGYKLLTKRTR